MKLRYLIPTFIAVFAMFVGCTSDDDPIYLDNIRMSSSFVSLSKDGGTTAIELTTAGDWSIVESTVPEWLTISPMSGAAGTVTQNYSADAVNATRKATIKMTCGSQTQEINIIQFAVESDPEIINIKDAVAMIKAGTQPEGAVYFKGIVCKIQEISPSYGNATFFLSDDGSYGSDNWLEVYRGKWFNGDNFTKGDEFAVGDELTVKGVLTLYNNSVPETVQGTAEVVAHVPSLIKVDSLDVTELPIEGGVVNAALVCKGSGISVEIPAEAQSWLSVIGIDTQKSTVKFLAQPNTGGDRNTAVTFKTVSGNKEYTASANIVQKGAIVEVTAAAFNAAAEGDTQYRLTGIITGLYASDKQGKSFYVTDYSGTALVYRAEGFIESGAKVGDVVTVVGKRSAYNNKPQMGSGTFEELKYAVTQVTIAEFLTKPEDAKTYYMVTGTIDKIDNATYGNVYIKDGDTSLYSYGCYPGWGATGNDRKNCIATKGIEVGDKLTLIGVKGSKDGVPQISNGIYFSHEKAQAVEASE